jgi:hypothetical protein
MGRSMEIAPRIGPLWVHEHGGTVPALVIGEDENEIWPVLASPPDESPKQGQGEKPF